jgi:hypothetical protein
MNVSSGRIKKKYVKSVFVFDLYAFVRKIPGFRDFSAAAHGIGGEQFSPILI